MTSTARTGGAPIDEQGFVPIRGVSQWISIAGDDRRNPVLLVLHGGPGAAFEPLAREAWRSWRAHFTVVHWDQPGSGRTYARNRTNAGPLTLDRIAQDGVAVAAHLRERLGARDVVLLGASWGSIVGLQMARLRPDLFTVYVGAGQVVDMAENEAVGYAALERRLAQRKAARALAQLRRIGPPPYPHLKALLAQRRILMAHPPASERGVVRRSLWRMLRAGYGPRLVGLWMEAQQRSAEALLDTVLQYREAERPQLPIPAVFIQGAEDIQTPTSLVTDYCERLQAPAKTMMVLPDGGHNALLFMPDAFLSALRRTTGRFLATTAPAEG